MPKCVNTCKQFDTFSGSAIHDSICFPMRVPITKLEISLFCFPKSHIALLAGSDDTSGWRAGSRRGGGRRRMEMGNGNGDGVGLVATMGTGGSVVGFLRPGCPAWFRPASPPRALPPQRGEGHAFGGQAAPSAGKHCGSIRGISFWPSTIRHTHPPSASSA